MTRYFFGVSQEEFPPEVLLRHAVAAERAGFDGISCLRPPAAVVGARRVRAHVGVARRRRAASLRVPLGTGRHLTGPAITRR